MQVTDGTTNFSALILSIGCFIVSAETPASWVETSRKTYQGSGEERIREILLLFPQLEQQQAEDLNSITVEVTETEWKGPTICKQGDPRLKLVSFDSEIHFKPGPDGKTSASSTSSARISGDPCIADLPSDGHWVLVNEQKTEFRSQREIASYIDERKIRFPAANPDEIESVSEHILSYRWEGKTTCKPGDPRLELAYDAGEIRFKEAPDAPITSIPPKRLNRDPCAL